VASQNSIRASGIGALVWVLTRKSKRELTIRDGFLLVALTWTLIALVASLPLILYFGAKIGCRRRKKKPLDSCAAKTSIKPSTRSDCQ